MKHISFYILLIALALLIGGCATGSFYNDARTTDLTRTNLVTMDDSYLVKEYACLLINHACMPPLGDKTLYFPEYNSDCAPPNITAFEKDPTPWQRVPRKKIFRGSCLLYFYAALPKGTKIRIERIDWFWSFDTGNRYTMHGRLLGPNYKDTEVIIPSEYFLLPRQSDDRHFHLIKWYFARANH